MNEGRESKPPPGDPGLTADACRPTNLHLDRQTGLHMEWADGRRSRFPLDYLRKHCPCAGCRGEKHGGESRPERPDGRALMSLTVLPKGIDQAAQVADAKLVGNYALQITWGDGHDTGIYDFRYLRSICPGR